MERFEGKVVRVTGGTAGIGLAVAKRFVSEGAKVIVGWRKTASVETVKAELGCEGLTCNVSSDPDREQLLGYIKKSMGDWTSSF